MSRINDQGDLRSSEDTEVQSAANIFRRAKLVDPPHNSPNEDGYERLETTEGDDSGLTSTTTDVQLSNTEWSYDAMDTVSEEADELSPPINRVPAHGLSPPTCRIQTRSWKPVSSFTKTMRKVSDSWKSKLRSLPVNAKHSTALDTHKRKSSTATPRCVVITDKKPKLQENIAPSNAEGMIIDARQYETPENDSIPEPSTPGIEFPQPKSSGKQPKRRDYDSIYDYYGDQDDTLDDGDSLYAPSESTSPPSSSSKHTAPSPSSKTSRANLLPRGSHALHHLAAKHRSRRGAHETEPSELHVAKHRTSSTTNNSCYCTHESSSTELLRALLRDHQRSRQYQDRLRALELRNLALRFDRHLHATSDFLLGELNKMREEASSGNGNGSSSSAARPGTDGTFGCVSAASAHVAGVPQPPFRRTPPWWDIVGAQEGEVRRLRRSAGLEGDQLRQCSDEYAYKPRSPSMRRDVGSRRDSTPA